MQQTTFSFTRLFTAGFLMLCFCTTAYPQLSKHGLIWYFGKGAGLDFSSGQPVQLNNISMDSYEGCAIYCDAAGKVLFYTNGGGFDNNLVNGPRDGIIWNRNQAVMYNMGHDKGGGYSAAQSSLILPKPGSSTLYYLFTMDHAPSLTLPAVNRGLSYFVIDMSLNGGLGDVVQADVRVATPAVENLTAIPNASGTGFWILTQDRNTNDFIVVPLSSAGVGLPFQQPRNNTNTLLAANVFKASPDGHFLYTDHQLYTFDRNTGAITFVQKIPADIYSVSFSPESKYLYTFPDDSGTGQLVRFDLNAPDITASQEMVGTADPNFPGLMQIGPDGSIYLIEQVGDDFENLTMSLSVIHCPDGPTPQFERSVKHFETDPLNAGGLFTSLPNFADYIFVPSPPEVNITSAAIADSCAIFPLRLKATGNKSGSFLWTSGATTDTLSIRDFGSYSVQFTDNCGMVARDTFTLNRPKKECCKFPEQYPNAFTPNGDQVNDTFTPLVGDCTIEVIDLSIFARWGELVFEGYHTTDVWDGSTQNGTQAQPDVYSYILRYKYPNETVEHTQRGEVSLIR